MARREAHPVQRVHVAKRSESVSVGAASVEVAPDRPDRVEIIVVNDHATQVAYLKLATVAVGDTPTAPTAVLNQGIRLSAAGGSWSSKSYTGPVAGIATGAATVCTVTEI